MVDSKGQENERKEGKNSGENVDSEEENEILEESPCGRWLKRREEVEQPAIPGIDASYLAMDTDEGVEVVWNEVRFSERKYFNAREGTISDVFDRLVQLEHPNIVKLHKYWIDREAERPRVIFITEYMSSGSLKQFLKKTKRHVTHKMALTNWKRWCTQILSALCYLHSSQPPIIHGNLNCDTIFISHNGLIKIGAVAPDAIYKHVKTFRGDSKVNTHYLAPEIGTINDDGSLESLPAVDIYSFGMCALEMSALGVVGVAGNGDATAHITEEAVTNTIESIDNPLQKDFIKCCLNRDPHHRPTARELLFHPVIYEVPSLRLLTAHVIVNIPSFQPEQLTEESLNKFFCLPQNNDVVLAEIKHSDNRPGTCLKQSDAPKKEFEKFLEEVRNGAYPLTAIVTTTRPPIVSRQRTLSPEVSGESAKQQVSPENPYDEETRRISKMICNVKPQQEGESTDKRLAMTLILYMEDNITKHISCEIESNDIPLCIAEELVYCGFINKVDGDMVATLISDTLNKVASQQKSVQNPLNQNPKDEAITSA